MTEEPIEDIVTQLHDNTDWLVRALAIRKLMPFGNRAVPHLECLFSLTFDAKAPIRSDSCALIKRLGATAVPYLLRRIDSSDPEHRARAINLLTECGFRKCSSTKLVEQMLESRNADLPDWGCDRESIIARLHHCLSDSDIRVRFAAASALEEFGRHIDDTIPVFIDVVQHGTDHARNWAALRLGRIGPSAGSACNALRDVDNSDSRYTSLAITNAIERIGCA